MIWRKLKITLNMIKFEHTVFALPLALLGAILARKGLPTAWQTCWIVVAMVGARSAAMAFNRIVDLRYDRLNPRTRERALPMGTLSIQAAVLFTIAMSFLFDAIKRKGATSEGIRAGLDSISLDTPQGHYTFTPQKHHGMPDSTNLMSQVKGGQFVPVGITQEQLAQAGQK